MCGIYGLFDPAGRSDHPAWVEVMGDTLTHRGPDERGACRVEGAVLGNERLSIIDLACGHQPFVSDDGQIVLVQNGEIFNHVELAAELERDGHPCRTRSDTEVLLRLYEQYRSLDFLPRLNGMFAIAVYDRAHRALWLARDRIGIKPLFTTRWNGRMLFASEPKAFVRAGMEPRLDREALDTLLTFNYVPPPRTIFEGVRHVMPGTVVRVTPEGTTTRRWWQVPMGPAQEVDDDEAIEELLHLLQDAVHLRMRADVEYGAFLSGGVDSSTVVGMMQALRGAPTKTFSIGFHDPRFDESEFAAAAANRFGTVHIDRRVGPELLARWPTVVYGCDQPHGDVSFIPTLELSDLASSHVKVVLTGDGGDELFAGYDKFREFFTPRAEADSLHAFKSAYLAKMSVMTPDMKRGLLRDASAVTDGSHVVAPLFADGKAADRLNQALYLDMALLLPGNNLVKPDRMGMAASIEARTPFLDYRVMEFAFRLPGHQKLRNGETKYLLKRAVTPLLGQELTYRRKQMFTVPIGEWFKDRLGPLMHDLLVSERVARRGIFDPKALAAMVDEHRTGRRNLTRQLRLIMAVELWCRIFLDGDYYPSDHLDPVSLGYSEARGVPS